MRRVAAIIAAVMSVTTGGPLRCPCHLIALLQPECCAAPVAQPAAERPVEHCCGCKAHRAPQPEPTDPQPSPHRPPCPHVPGIDLVPPHAPGERAASGHELGDPAVMALGGGHVSASARASDSPPPVPVTLAASPPDRLRYSHAFRC